MKTQFKKLEHDATIPTRATDGSAGFDLYSMYNLTIHPGANAKIPTGIACAIPEKYAGFVWPRSGFAVKHGIDILAGLIDSDYRGELHVCLINHGDNTAEVRKGDRIAQMVVSPVLTDSEEVKVLANPGTRSGGFGSTGA